MRLSDELDAGFLAELAVADAPEWPTPSDHPKPFMRGS